MQKAISLLLLVGLLGVSGVSQARFASTDVQVKVAKQGEMLSKAALLTEIYKDHNRKYWKWVAGMFPLYLDGNKTPLEGYCVDIVAKADDFSATSMTLKSADASHVQPATQSSTVYLLPELVSSADVDRIAYIIDRYPLTNQGTDATKLRGAAIQTFVWRVLYGETPFYTVYPTVTPVMADMALHDNDPQRTDLEIENLAQGWLAESQDKHLMEAKGGSLNVLLQLDPTINRVKVTISAQQGTQLTSGQPFHLTTSNGTFPGGATTLDGETDTSGTFVTYVNDPAPTGLAPLKSIKGVKRSKRSTTEIRTVNVTATATGRTVYLLLSANSSKQDLICTIPGDYTQDKTLRWNTSISTKGSIEQLPFWQHHVWYHAANNIPNGRVSKAELMSFLPFEDIDGNLVDTFEELYDILKGSLATGNAYHKARANQYYTALRLNIAYALIGNEAMVDTDADKTPDMRLSDALVQIHALYNSGAYSAAKNICKSINAM